MKHPRDKSCTHPAEQLRPAIGPSSGILCGLCGQDVPSAIVFALLIDQLTLARAQINELVMAGGLSKCTSCGQIRDSRVHFHGIKNQDLCISCLERWLDNDDGDLDQMNVGYLAQFMLSHDIRSSGGGRERLANMAHQAFPQLASQIKRRIK